MNMLWTIVAAVWGFSALAVVVLFVIDERAHRRHKARQAATVEAQKVSVPTTTARHKQLATSGAR